MPTACTSSSASFQKVGFIPTGIGAHGLYPSRDGKRLYERWPVPGGGSPDMGNVSADGKYLWLAARYDDVVYRFDTANGDVARIEVGAEPHGLTVWPQPGRYSLGHIGNLR